MVLVATLFASMSYAGPAAAQAVNGVNVCFDAAGRAVRTIPAPANRIHDVARATRDAFGPVVYYDPNVISSMPRPVALFVFAHECGHHALGQIINYNLGVPPVPFVDEQAADCYGINQLVTNSLIGEADIDLIQRSFSRNGGDATHLPGPIRALNLRRCLNSASSTSNSDDDASSAGAAKHDADQCLKYSDRDVDWHTTADNPIVRIKASYNNDCAYRIRCKITLAVGTVDRHTKDDDDWQSTASTTYLLSLPANETRSARVTLRWTATSDRMPRIHVPTEDEYSDAIACSKAG